MIDVYICKQQIYCISNNQDLCRTTIGEAYIVIHDPKTFNIDIIMSDGNLCSIHLLFERISLYFKRIS